jgi:glycerol-3-phosphate cytidylyltransferase
MNCLLELHLKKSEGLKIGFTASTFDLLHPGHIVMLSECKANCNFLVVGLLTDPTISRPESKMKPAQTTLERYIQLQAVSYVDCIIPFDTEPDLEQLIKLIMPDIRFVGEEYKGVEFTGKNIEGVELFYNSRRHNFSSTEIKNRLKK